MIDVIKQQFTEGMPHEARINLTREFLQIICLKIMNEKKMFDQVAFLGGTALRILYNLRRFSEDLDFSTIVPDPLNSKMITRAFIKGFEKYGFPVEAQTKNTQAVLSILFKFEGLLKELELSDLASQRLSIKWDVDQNPPLGATTTNTIINKHFMFNVSHYDLPSLFAGKLHACFFRAYIKGRDWYDFLWYISQKLYPNFELLNNAIEQTQKTKFNIRKNNFKEFLIKRVEEIDFEKAQKDVERFLEDKDALTALNTEYVLDTINVHY